MRASHPPDPPPTPGNPFIATDFTRPSGSSSPRSGLRCVCVARSGKSSSQKIQHTTGHLAELAMTSNLTTNWKTNKSPQDISIKEPEIYVSNRTSEYSIVSFFLLCPHFSLLWHTHTHTHARLRMCACTFTHLHPPLLPLPVHFRSLYLKPPSPGYFTFISNLHLLCPQPEFINCFLFFLIKFSIRRFNISASPSIPFFFSFENLSQSHWRSWPTLDLLVFRLLAQLEHHLGNFIHHFPVEFSYFLNSMSSTILIVFLISTGNILQLLFKKGCAGNQFLRPHPSDNILLLFWPLIDSPTGYIHFKVLNNVPSELLGYCSVVFWCPVQLLENPMPFWSMFLCMWCCFSLWKLFKKLLLIFFLSLVFWNFPIICYMSYLNMLTWVNMSLFAIYWAALSK